ncbi:MAG: carboxypeptidase regulatory-like domain-containing protein [Acidobacteriota bacterium]|nr:carboxypeptidase regulatory-like domain-containing protein [Acidobacteriota bacterium]
MKHLIRFVFSLVAILAVASTVNAQVTTGSLRGKVQNEQQQPVAGASVIAIHLPSGSSYEATTRNDGGFSIVGMRVGGPYSVTVAYSGGGAAAFAPETQENIEVNQGVATDQAFKVRAIAVTETVTVTAQSDAVFASNRTGAATAVTREEMASLPTISNRLESFARLTPSMGGNMSFAGQDNRMNNITVDGSYFNNSFGLGGQPGDRTGVAPISMDAIEQVQINVAPFDVRSGNFVGAGINSVTRSGTNQFRGSGFYQFRDDGLVGKEAKDLPVNPGTFSFKNYGGWAAGPILENKLFFFGNAEKEETEGPGTTFRANAGGEAAVGSTTRVLASDLTALSSFLKQRFGYDTGPFQDYAHLTPGRRLLAKFDYNISNRNKLSFRYNQLDSDTDVLLSNSSSLGFGNRRTSTFGLNFQNSNYKILENIKSGVGELNTVIGSTMSNSLIVGYSSHDESRESLGSFFPMVDILEGGSVYTTFGFEPFTPNNELRYKSFQLQNNFSKFSEKHTWTAGFSFERYESENVFFPGSQSVYVYNSLQDFYDDANRVRPVTLNRFQVRYNNIPGQDKPIQPLEVVYTGGYIQDEWTVNDKLKLIAGLRMDVPIFGETGYTNVNADALTFRDETGAAVQYQSGKLPDANLLWSPRLGFNWDVTGSRNTQVRGGSGVFTGKPLFVWISNQIGNTGVLTGFIQNNNSTANPFNPDPNAYKPTNVTGAPATSYELALTDQNFKFPQVWRTNVAVDRRLPGGITGTAEFIYNKDVNGMYYINANLPAAQTSFVGADNRPRWTSNRINNVTGNQVSNATVIKNQDVGTAWNAVFSAKKNTSWGMVQAAYNYGESKNTVDPGSIAFGSWSNNAHSGDPNNPGTSYAGASPGHRFFMTGSYRKQYFGFGATAISAFFEARTIGNTSYTFAGDMNGDGGFNDLLYIHASTGEMNFAPFTSGGVTYTAAQQAAAWEAYIAQDSYLSKNRGKYAERGAVFLPMVKRLDVSVTQDVFTSGGGGHRFQFRADFINFGNLLNKNWGVSQRLVSNQPLTNPAVDAAGQSTYRLRLVSGQLMSQSYQQTADLNDVYRIAFSLKYFFGS